MIKTENDVKRVYPLRAVVMVCAVFECLVGALPAHADIFMREDEGSVVLTNVPNDSRFKRLLKEPVNLIAARNEPSTAPLNGRGRRLYASVIADAAVASGLPEALLHAVIEAESNYNADAISPKGAVGLMQLMPATARQYGAGNSRDPRSNVSAGARYLKDLMDMFNNDVKIALAAYNAGPQSVIRNGLSIPPFRETQHYVPKVLSLFQRNTTLSSLQ